MKRTSKVLSILLSLILCLGVVFSIAPNRQVNAATRITNKEARNILKKKVKNKFCKYAFIDVDKDNIDELIVLDFNKKFRDGDAKEKYITVYKMFGKKAKPVLDLSMNGDLFHPSFSFDVYYSDGESYITVVWSHEGYAYYWTYMLGSKQYKQVARLEDFVSGDEQYYYRGTEEASKEDYEEFMNSIAPGKIDYKLKSPSVKVANKYLRKMLKAEFNYQCKCGIFDKNVVSPIYSDEDGDGIDELIVREGPLGGKILYVAMPEANSVEYLVFSSEYTLNNGIEETH
ncbi:MAG: hypothetical protein ILP10_07305 [Lachnospiraceae bacterium]|nr:hypothetical protein [Lachnospiraceae bacterium]